MPLVPCQECNKRISDRAASCPHCGCPNDPEALLRANLADQQRLRILGEDPSAGLPDAATLREVERKRKFWAMIRAQYWKVFGILVSFVAFSLAVISPIVISISTSSASPLILLFLPVVSLVGSSSFFNIRPNLSGFFLGLIALACLFLGGLIVQLGFANAGGIDANSAYCLVGWLIFFAYWVVNRKAPAAIKKATLIPGHDDAM